MLNRWMDIYIYTDMSDSRVQTQLKFEDSSGKTKLRDCQEQQDMLIFDHPKANFVRTWCFNELVS